MTRPKRKAIPKAVKREVLLRQRVRCKCGCGIFQDVASIHFDHEPALRLRAVNAAGTDYEPPQHSAAHIDARCRASHDLKTRGAGATTAGTDIGKIKKMRRHEGNRARISPKIRSRGFAKVHRPFSKKKRPGSAPGL